MTDLDIINGLIAHDEKITGMNREKGDALCAVRCEEYELHCFGIHKPAKELTKLAMSRHRCALNF